MLFLRFEKTFNFSDNKDIINKVMFIILIRRWVSGKRDGILRHYQLKF